MKESVSAFDPTPRVVSNPLSTYVKSGEVMVTSMLSL